MEKKKQAESKPEKSITINIGKGYLTINMSEDAKAQDLYDWVCALYKLFNDDKFLKTFGFNS